MIHFREELDEMQSRLLEMAGLVESAIHQSVAALVQRDEQAAKEVLWKEALINQKDIEIDEYATRLLALYQPMARDMRFLTAVIKINGDLERMGDLAVNITQRAISLMREPPVKPLIDIPQMASLAEDMVRKSLDALVKRDEELARGVLLSDDEVDRLRDAVYKELVAFMQEQSTTIPRAVDLMFIAHNLERIADHATNIAEDVLFLVKGIDVRHHAEVREQTFPASSKRAPHPYNRWIGTRLSLLLFRSPEVAVLGLGAGRPAAAAAGAWRPGSRAQLGLGGALAARAFSRLRHGPARARQQRLGARRHLQHRRTCSRHRDTGGLYWRGGRPVHLIGHSLGGILTLLYSGLYPDRVRKVDRHRRAGIARVASHSQTRAGALARLDRKRPQGGTAASRATIPTWKPPSRG